METKKVKEQYYKESRMRYLRVLFHYIGVVNSLDNLEDLIDVTEEGKGEGELSDALNEAREELSKMRAALDTIKGFKCSRVDWNKFIEQEKETI